MKITREQLRQIIKEEARRLNEQERRSDLTPPTVERYRQALHDALADLGYKFKMTVENPVYDYTAENFSDKERPPNDHTVEIRIPKPSNDPYYTSRSESDDED